MQVIGAPIAAGLMMMDGLRGIRGWKWLFLIEGAITVLFGILFFVSALPSGRSLPCAHCMMCAGQWGPLRPPLATVMLHAMLWKVAASTASRLRAPFLCTLSSSHM